MVIKVRVLSDPRPSPVGGGTRQNTLTDPGPCFWTSASFHGKKYCGCVLHFAFHEQKQLREPDMGLVLLFARAWTEGGACNSIRNDRRHLIR